MEDYKMNHKFHKKDISKLKFLVTGGAGFIGSNIVRYLIKNNAGFVRVVDNLSNGDLNNIKDFINLSNFEFIENDLVDIEVCKKAIDGIQYVSHQAARGSVPRSISDPISSNSSNVTAFLNLINVCKDSKEIKNFVYASSSSVYGDSKSLIKSEGNEGEPLNPYALTKIINEMYAENFYKIYDFKSIGLRYFNVFGPNQSPDNPYAAVIPIFLKKISRNLIPTIYGDGFTIRDFTFIDNVVQANILAMFNETVDKHTTFNVGCGQKTSLIELVDLINEISSKKIIPVHDNERLGDIKTSVADISKIKKYLNYNPLINIKEGLQITYYDYL